MTGLPAKADEWAAQQASELASLWQARPDDRPFTVLCSHFGQGLAFQATLQTWRSSSRRPRRLVYISSANDWPAEAPDAQGTPAPPTRNVHLQDFEQGHVRLLLAIVPSANWRLWRQVQADVLWIDGRDFRSGSASAHQATAAMKSIARLAAPRARLALCQATAEQAAALRASGFVFETAAATAEAVQTACFLPRMPKRPGSATVATGALTAPVAAPVAAPAAAPAAASSVPGEVVIIGAGIAGACAAAALAQRGWRCTVLDQRAHPAGGASGNPAAIFHGTVHAADGLHARFTRAAALHAQRVHAGLLARGVPGRIDGLLRAGVGAAPAQHPRWAQLWPAERLRASGSGLCADSAWFFPGGGWIDAVAAVGALLAGPDVVFRGQASAAGLRRQGHRWQVLDAGGGLLAEADAVVLAGAAAGDQHAPTMATLLQQAGAEAWPATSARGQVSWFEHAGPALPWPVAGSGYAISLPGPPRLLCGATTQPDDEDPRPRDADDAYNLARLLALTGRAAPAGQPLQQRVAWRERVADRLPVVGAAVDAEALRDRRAGAALPGVWRLPRVPGLFVLGAMAGRGFTWGPLAAEVLASWVDGTPQPLEAELLDALDPARFWLRQARREVRP